MQIGTDEPGIEQQRLKSPAQAGHGQLVQPSAGRYSWHCPRTQTLSKSQTCPQKPQ